MNARWMRIDRSTLLSVVLVAIVFNSPTWMNVPAKAADGLLASEPRYDVVVYGGTSSGVAAAVQAHRMGKSVVLIEPTRRLGGLTSGGLGQTDIGNKAAIGGVAREFYQAVRKHYADPAAWRWQTRAEYADNGQTRTASGEDAMWTFEPGVALKIFDDWVRENRLEVVYGERLDRKSGVAMTRSVPWRITAIRMESGRTFSGQMFIDATYEGDLMAAANVSYTIGREGNAQYNETLNGVQAKHAKYHQLVPGIDPYVTPGDPSSGLLPFIDPTGPGDEGGADRRVQAYCFRMCLTDHPDNRIPFHKPVGYDQRWYELLLRNYEGGERGMPWINSPMPNRKTDTNNRLGFSTDFIGQNYDYPEASYEQREQILARHRLYQQGLMWTLANHPRIPEAIRREVSRWGMCRDEFTEGQGWQEQLYVREARRMVSDCVMTQHHCQGQVTAEDPIGLAAYGMDSHHVQRYVDADGQVRNEGDVEVGGFSPYPISYRAIVPKADQCGNLLVPVCLSATHIAFGSIRMEPVFMVLGQSAATAAAHAIDEHVAVQRVDYAKLRKRLLADKQVLVWTAKPIARTDGGWQAGNTVELTGLKVTLSKPVLVARSKGYLWFPTVVRLSNGELAAMMSDYADEHVAQGTSRITWSADGGLTWSPPSQALGGDGTLILPNGDLLWMPYYLRPLEKGGMGAPYQLCPRGQRTLRVVQPGVTIEGWPRPDKSFAPQLGISGFVCNGQTVPLKAGGYLATLYGHFRDIFSILRHQPSATW